MGWFSSLVGGVISAATTIIDVASKTVKDILNAAHTAYQNYFGDNDQAQKESSERTKEKAKDELKEVNNELIHLRRKRNLTPDDRRRMDDLVNRRDELTATISGADEISVASEINETPNAFDKFEVDNDRAHIFQGMVGPSSFGKKCPTCGREMQLQWARNITTVSTHDFFWGCTGWYEQACRFSLPVTRDEMNIFTRVDAPEYDLTNREFTDLILMPRASDLITERMNDSISDQRRRRSGAENYRCPVHGEDLVLREKRQATGLLDQYFLGCPRWQDGCSHMIKLKSAAQLSTYLLKETGRGIL